MTCYYEVLVMCVYMGVLFVSLSYMFVHYFYMFVYCFICMIVLRLLTGCAGMKTTVCTAHAHDCAIYSIIHQLRSNFNNIHDAEVIHDFAQLWGVY